MSLDRDAMYKLFEESPGDLTAYGAMADLLDELGYSSLAHAFRWMSRRGKFPHKRDNYAIRRGSVIRGRKVPSRFRWAWYSWGEFATKEVLGIYPVVSAKPHLLPSLLMSGDQKVYVSHQAAVMALADWLKVLREVYAAEEPKKPEL